ncbi:hypothetical protein ACOTEY_07770 [Achromobacter xylosoxidans]
MKTSRSVLRPLLAMLACASITACADDPPRQATDLDYRSRPSPSMRGATSSPDQRLSIQSGEGEKLNLPWFIQDTQDWINRN